MAGRRKVNVSAPKRGHDDLKDPLRTVARNPGNVPRKAVEGLDQSQRSKSTRDPHRRRRERHEARKKILMVEAMDVASNYDISISKGNNIVDVLQALLDRLMDKWRVVCMEVDQLERQNWLVEKRDEQGNVLVEPNVWLQYEATLRSELMDLSIRMGHLGVDERRVRVAEAQVQLLGRAVQIAAQNAGLEQDQQRQLGAALRVELEKLDNPGDYDSEAVASFKGESPVGRVRKSDGRKDERYPDIPGTAEEMV